jgi:hypothetical protein
MILKYGSKKRLPKMHNRQSYHLRTSLYHPTVGDDRVLGRALRALTMQRRESQVAVPLRRVLKQLLKRRR